MAVAAGMDPQMYKMMKTIQADPDALDFDEFDASRSVAYNWTDYFYDNETWFSTTDSTLPTKVITTTCYNISTYFLRETKSRKSCCYNY